MVTRSGWRTPWVAWKGLLGVGEALSHEKLLVEPSEERPHACVSNAMRRTHLKHGGTCRYYVRPKSEIPEISLRLATVTASHAVSPSSRSFAGLVFRSSIDGHCLVFEAAWSGSWRRSRSAVFNRLKRKIDGMALDRQFAWTPSRVSASHSISLDLPPGRPRRPQLAFRCSHTLFEVFVFGSFFLREAWAESVSFIVHCPSWHHNKPSSGVGKKAPLAPSSVNTFRGTSAGWFLFISGAVSKEPYATLLLLTKTSCCSATPLWGHPRTPALSCLFVYLPAVLPCSSRFVFLVRCFLAPLKMYKNLI